MKSDLSPLLIARSLSSMDLKPINIRLIGTVLSHTDKLCIASHYRQFSTNNKINKTSLDGLRLRPLGTNKFFYFNIRGKLSILRSDKNVLQNLWIIKNTYIENNTNETGGNKKNQLTIIMYKHKSQLNIIW